MFTFYQRSTGQGWRYSWLGYGLTNLTSEKKIDYFLHGPQSELYTVTGASYPLPPSAAIHPSVFCARCGERTAEPNLRVSEGQMICLDCAGHRFDFETRVAL